jgi:hypothetical protein
MVKENIEKVFKNAKNGALEVISEASLKTQKSLISLEKMASDILVGKNASVVGNGRRDRGRTCDHLDVDHVGVPTKYQ